MELNTLTIGNAQLFPEPKGCQYHFEQVPVWLHRGGLDNNYPCQSQSHPRQLFKQFSGRSGTFFWGIETMIIFIFVTSSTVAG
jgi:hypothetical protein